ncbi:uncharacterized protein LOC121773559 [Salvia splendens]|uniref:uncharacterized protein LOC121773559 n=1 Tax=Salvia splendens TaxID=180675 RepID=UPI001C26F020|nr:uncharacterized protein LOC121773559 [Salvia splendens]
MVNTRNTDTRLEGLEKVTGDLEKKTETLTAMVDELNLQCSKTGEQVTTIGAQLETFMAEVRTALATRSSSKATDPPPDDDSTGNTTATGNNSNLPMPTFDGTDTLAWLARAEQYFLVSKTSPEKRLDIAMVALAGPALPWFLLLRRRLPTLSWEQFKREIMKRFGDKMALDGYEAFASTRQEGSLVDFVAAFEARLAQIPDLADHQYLGFFLAALRPEIRMHLKAAQLTSYSDAVQMALQLDQLSGTHQVSQPLSSAVLPPQGMSRPNPKGFSPTPASFSSSGPNRPSRFRNISSEEYKKHIAAGTCFKCGLKFGPTHRCPPKTLNVLVIDDDDPMYDDVETENQMDNGAQLELQLSELSCNGLDTSRTMKLFGGIESHKILVMVDSGASHCFISDQLVSRLQLPITPTSPYSVTLGNGSSVGASGICTPCLFGWHLKTFPCPVTYFH